MNRLLVIEFEVDGKRLHKEFLFDKEPRFTELCKGLLECVNPNPETPLKHLAGVQIKHLELRQSVSDK